MSESFDCDNETRVYTELAEFIDNLIAKYPVESKKWRGVMGVMLLRSFLETALKSDMSDAHEIMKAYDIMSDHIYEIYRNQESLSWESPESQESPESDSSLVDNSTTSVTKD